MVGITVPAHGPQPATVLVIGEFPTVDDERRMRLFSGQTGTEFHKMLHEAGFLATEIRFTTLLRSRPYNSQMKYVWTKVKKEAELCMGGKYEKRDSVFLHRDYYELTRHISQDIEGAEPPNVIIALGDAVLWHLTGETSVAKWRGSLMKYDTLLDEEVKVIPTYSPAQIMRMWEWRTYAVRDLQRAKAESSSAEWVKPEMRFTIRPTFDAAIDSLQAIIDVAGVSRVPIPITCDIETISRHIACIGFAWSKKDAICIPFMDKGHTHFYSPEEETAIIWEFRQVLTHPNIRVVGQNFSYDTQHIVRSWGYRPKLDFDTMLAQHVLFPGLPKDLGFLASMYCEQYVYWKDELTDYRTLPADLEKFWLYNCKDNVNTFEIYEVLNSLIDKMGFRKQFDFIMRLNHHVITMMIRGVAIDQQEKNRLSQSLLEEINKRQCEIDYLISWSPEARSSMLKTLEFDEKKNKTVLKRDKKAEDHGELNISSSKQMKQLFYDELKMKMVFNRKTHEPTTDDDALQTFALREPILKPLVDLISETRSIGVFLSTFVLMQLDVDKRMRCSYNTGGTETFRFSSSKNAFGSGGNLQNIPSGTEDEKRDPTVFVFPNLRRMFIPDQGYMLFDVDLAGADAQVVAWEAEDVELKQMFREGVKIHAHNAKAIYGRDAGPDGLRKPYYKQAKMGTHLSNYGGRPPTLSKALGMSIHEAEAFQKRWFAMHPGIKTWHEEVENSLMTTRSVRNKFGFRRFYPDRIERLLPEALAWVPQSTIACVINTGLCQITEATNMIQILMQTHDSLTGQFLKSNQFLSIPILREKLKVVVPYSDPLIIGTSIDLSEKSWGDLIQYKWSDLGVN